jgi:hypothetical protein
VYQEWLKKKLDRNPFTYDVNADALYQQLKDNYIQQGKMAMEDAMGQAAAMTGGYGNSYAATVGNQAYQVHLENLNDIIPELYQMALEKYDMEGREIAENLAYLESDYAKHLGEEERDYSRLLDKIDIANFDLDNSISRYNSEKKNNNNIYDPFKDDESAGKPVTGGGYNASYTENVNSFKSAIRTRSEFNRGTNEDKAKYKTYEAYLDAKLEEWYQAGKLDENELATLIAYYGLT